MPAAARADEVRVSHTATRRECCANGTCGRCQPATPEPLTETRDVDRLTRAALAGTPTNRNLAILRLAILATERQRP